MEILIIIGIVFIGWLLFEFATFLLPIIGVIIALFIIIYICDKKAEKNKENKYLNNPNVKKELDMCFERVKLLHKACQHSSSGYVMISRANYGIFDIIDTKEPDHEHETPRVYVSFEFINSYPLEIYKNSCHTYNSNEQIWAAKELAKSIFNISLEELENSPLDYWDLFNNAQYSESDYRCFMVMYITAPFVKDANLTEELRRDYFTKKLEQMYKEYEERTPKC